MNYEEKYNSALERASKLRVQNPFDTVSQMMEHVFPELKEPEDEKIRKQIISFLREFEYDHYRNLDFSSWIAWLEKQCEQPKEFTYTYEAEVGNGNIKGLITEKVQLQKFHEGDWITFYGGKPFKILKVESEQNGILDYLLARQYGYVSYYNKKYVDENARLWTIEDAKPGDMLASKDGDDILIFRNLDTAINFSSYYNLRGKGEFGWSNKSFIPATKEQRDTLMKAMADDGYTFDFEKKELKKIHNALEECEIEHIEHGKYYYCIKDYYSGGYKRASKGEVVKALRGMSMMALGVKANEYFIPVKCIIDVSNSLSEEDEEEYNDEDYGIDGLYHAKEILERTLGEVDGYQSDDGILEHKCAISAVKKLYEQKPVRSEEDERNLKGIIDEIEANKNQAPDYDLATYDRFLSWLESLKDGYTWKPNEEQIKAVKRASSGSRAIAGNDYLIMESLYNDLKKL